MKYINKLLFKMAFWVGFAVSTVLTFVVLTVYYFLYRVWVNYWHLINIKGLVSAVRSALIDKLGNINLN